MVILVAWILDLLFGEPPIAIHPVVWMGGYLAWVRQRLPSTLFAGIFGWWGGAFLVLSLGYCVQFLIFQLSVWIFPELPSVTAGIQILLTGMVLKPLFAWKALREAVEAVGSAEDLTAARQRLGDSLVSRVTKNLSATEVYGAAIESLTENLSDSVVAPLFYFALAGIPGAALYRYVNTADAMWGYRTPELEWFGKWAARIDDGFNWFPARITGLVLCLSSPLVGQDLQGAWRVWRRDGGKTPSPNAGQPMSAASGSLGIHLSKPGVYDLGSEQRDPESGDIERAVLLAGVSAWWVVLCIAGAIAVLKS